MMKQKVKNIHNLNAKNELARVMANERLFVRHLDVETASMDVENRILTLPIWENMPEDTYKRFISHEVAHAIYTPKKASARIFQESSKKRISYINAIEDVRIERDILRKYKGLKREYKTSTKYFKERDFFGDTKYGGVDRFPFCDRLNVFYKVNHYDYENGYDLSFNDKEISFLKRAYEVSSFEDVIKLADEILEYSEEERKQNEENGENASDGKNGSGESLKRYRLNENGEKTEEKDCSNLSPISINEVENLQEKDIVGEDSEKDADNEQNLSGFSKKMDQNAGDQVVEGTHSKDFDSLISQNEINKNINLNSEKVNKASIPIHVKIGSFSVEDFIVPYTKVLDAFTFNTNFNNFNRKDILPEDTWENYKKSVNPLVSSMVMEFNKKKKAEIWLSGQRDVTGELDLNKLHSHKFSNDVFLSEMKYKKGKKHSLVLFVDFSGSMVYSLGGVFMHLYTLLKFCKKTGIKFKVYGFSDSITKYSTMDNSKLAQRQNKMGTNIIIPNSRLSLVELFTSEMKPKDFEEMFEKSFNVFIQAEFNHKNFQLENTYLKLGTTPLNDSIIVAHKLIPKIKEYHKTDIINCVFLTDGISDTVKFMIKENSTVTAAVNRSRPLFVVAKNNKEIPLFDNDKSQHDGTYFANNYSETVGLVESLKFELGINVINFHIDDNLSGFIKYGRHHKYLSQDFNSSKKKKYKIADGIFSVLGKDVRAWDAFFAYDLKKFMDIRKIKQSDNDTIDNKNTKEKVKFHMSDQKSKRSEKKILNSFVELIS